jgi:hypothetical protein
MTTNLPTTYILPVDDPAGEGGQPPNQLNTGAVRSFTVPSRPPLLDDDGGDVALVLGGALLDDGEPDTEPDCDCVVDGEDVVGCVVAVLGAACVLGPAWLVVGDCAAACADEVLGIGATVFVDGTHEPEIVPWDAVFVCWGCGATPFPARAGFELPGALDGAVASDCDGTCGDVVMFWGVPLSASTMSPPDLPPEASVSPGALAGAWLRNRLPTTAPSASTAPAATPLSALRVARDLA